MSATINGIDMEWRERGEGTPIVFIHGFGGDLNNWQFNQEALADGHDTYAVDLPGHGGSSKELGPGHVHVGALATARSQPAHPGGGPVGVVGLDPKA